MTSTYSFTSLSSIATSEEALALFDTLAPVDLDFMMGRWRGGAIATDHPMDGLLEVANWYGKEFVSPECVHPLLFPDGKGDTYKVAPNAQLMKMALRLPLLKSDSLSPFFSVSLPLFKTDKSQARLRMMSHRGQVSATMIYDHLPIHDVFKKVDDNSVLGLMDYKETPEPFFFTLKRETPRA
ncbi:MAG: DUF4334 domain-containing protein [Cyanobacteria bacterium J06627_28]